MEKAHFSAKLMKHISEMDCDNSVVQFSIPGKGRFTLILQEEAEPSILADVVANPKLELMIKESQEQYKKGFGMLTSELLKSVSAKHFFIPGENK